MVHRNTVALLLALALIGTLVYGRDSPADTASRLLWHEIAPDPEVGFKYEPTNNVMESRPLGGVMTRPAAWSQQQKQQQKESAKGVTADAHLSNEDESDSPVSFSCTGRYPKVEWGPWSHIAEPHSETVLVADSTVGDPDKDIFTWIFPSENGAVYEGREIRYVFKSVGKKPVTLVQSVVATGEQISYQGTIVVKYVRRELRALHDEDRELFFRVLEILYRVPTTDGKKIYGEDYKGIDYFVQMHLDGAGTKDCDHWHDDAGIVTHHVAYTLLFEQSMQRIAPSLSIPYWEYTIEASQGVDNYGQSIVFDDDWFGEFNPQNDMHTMDRGRFAFLPIMKDAWDYVHNSYGHLRTPWNLISSPFVTRHNTTNGEVPTALVNCYQFSTCLSSSSLSVMNECLNGLTHGPVHILTGGQWGNEEEDFIARAGYFMLAPLITKFLWRKGYIRLPDRCTVGEECVSSCPAEVYESRGMDVYDVLMDVHAPAWMSLIMNGTVVYDSEKDMFHMGGDKSRDVQEAFWLKMLHSFCNPGYVGEMYTSAAPYDPLFWVVHPTIDRLLAWRRLLAQQNPDEWAFDEEWGYEHGFTIGDTGVVCDWTEVEPGTTQLPHCIKGTCGGHRENDMLPFKVEINGETRQYTNAEWMTLVYPTNEDLPYMYDRFRWDHCNDDGFDMGTTETSST